MSEVTPQAGAAATTQAPAATTEPTTPAPAQQTTLLTGGDAPPAPAPTEAAKPAEGEKPVEIKYEVTLPKDSLLPATRVDEIVQYAKERGLSNDDAKALLEREDNATKQFRDSLVNSHQEQLKQWTEAAQNDKEIGGQAFAENLNLSKTVLKDFGTPELEVVLSKTGWGNHPELIRLLTRIGKAYAPDTMVQPGQMPAQQRSAADVLYGT